MTQTTASSIRRATKRSGLRSLYAIRVIFSVIWVVLVVTATSGLGSDDTPTAIAAVLLVIYPLWDVVATALERRLAGAGSTNRLSILNIVLGLVATVAMIVAVFHTVGAMLLVFGIWALVAGAIQLVTAIGRWRTVGAQWPMAISGLISVFAGGSFAAMSASSSSSLSTLGGYSGFGAFWFLVAVIMLTLRGRRDTA